MKSGRNNLSEHQCAMFELLEEGGIAVYVWWSAKPNRLQSWRAFYHGRSEAIAMLAVLGDA